MLETIRRWALIVLLVPVAALLLVLYCVVEVPVVALRRLVCGKRSKRR